MSPTPPTPTEGFICQQVNSTTTYCYTVHNGIVGPTPQVPGFDAVTVIMAVALAILLITLITRRKRT